MKRFSPTTSYTSKNMEMLEVLTTNRNQNAVDSRNVSGRATLPAILAFLWFPGGGRGSVRDAGGDPPQVTGTR
jgi:hypothetical protein